MSRTAAENLLERLRSAGVDYLLGNAGTDFPPIIEAYGRLGESNPALPTPLAVLHETVAMGMAHGYWLASGRPLAVMVHVNVGLANCVMGLINAASENVPIVLLSGRTPLTESGRPGSRSLPVHWAQEMYDQNALVRGSVKWDYELRSADQGRLLVERAVTIAMSDPPGPVYLSLPREPLAEMTNVDASADAAISPSRAGPPASDAVERAADLLARAERPLLIATRPVERGGFGPLPGFADAIALPVAEFWATRNAMPTGHEMHVGHDPNPWLADADVVVVLESLVPWIRSQAKLAPGARVIAIGLDPLHQRTPVRAFPVDVNLAGDPAAALASLHRALTRRGLPDAATIASRRRRVAERRAASLAARDTRIAAGRAVPMSPAYVSHAIARHAGDDAVFFSELGMEAGAYELDRPGAAFANPLSAGLGWAVPAALGHRLADPSRIAIATVGDGSYIFANPVACHQTAAMHGLPILTIIFNNGVWNAVRRATIGMYPKSEAAAANVMPLTSLGPPPDYAAIAAAHGAFAQKVEDPAGLDRALAAALAAVRGGRQALLDVTVSY